MQRCLADRDCEGELVCLYSHSLPSMLHYISRQNPLAFTCGMYIEEQRYIAIAFTSLIPRLCRRCPGYEACPSVESSCSVSFGEMEGVVS